MSHLERRWRSPKATQNARRCWQTVEGLRGRAPGFSTWPTLRRINGKAARGQLAARSTRRWPTTGSVRRSPLGPVDLREAVSRLNLTP